MIERGKVLFTPKQRLLAECRLTAFARFARDAGVYAAPAEADPGEASYASLHAWTIEQPDEFWRCLGEFFEVRELASAGRVLSSRSMPGARWFEGASLNYAAYA